ncbi:Predicted secreted hydrolase [Rhodoblastus acidophilus]|uniref:Predicted secreted hydrolase n=1 Tax=Rhodoblastus acidophilus TaxID=1074 RepID=A0A212R267_RHOAC|nr:lipocalin-like domain-containing protein [Rhodoblastus acidophilus]PPQ40326.1 iron ABC transporter permease [Rhodoblastus acidophilus]RAI16885.1 iron ABC transporter permease [Rhodoblastus acidophilus]SNB66099.1 Predicted secreted hydrolase [Rhodoblastus acidophilus]
MNAKALAFVLLALGSPAAAQGFAGLGGEAAGFEQVVPGKPLVFPQDFGAHPTFRTEWWYLTANLTDETGAPYGVQWTLFRQAGTPGEERSGWANQNVWMGHAAVTTATDHVFAETFARGGVGQAGALAQPFHAWIDDWSFSSEGDGLARAKISASGDAFRYAFDLAADGPLAPQGDGGFSLKSDEGGASYYFSQPFYKISGVVTLRGKEVKLKGLAWMDREWSSQPLGKTQKGWDWFSLHLASGEKVMLFRLRDETGRDFQAGTWISAGGAPQKLDRDDIVLTPLAQNEIAGRTLPARWRVQVKSRGLDVETKPVNPASFMATSFPYWEGPIAFDGSQRGEGYLEMTGYAPQAQR